MRLLLYAHRYCLFAFRESSPELPKEFLLDF